MEQTERPARRGIHLQLGSCPSCGMALGPADPAEETGPSPELLDMSRSSLSVIGNALRLRKVEL